ncbi:MAG: sugar transferase [Gammaproteobacteria bacterium]|nr:sugar transferase [Gammaproteobacteria bacterium]
MYEHFLKYFFDILFALLACFFLLPIFLLLFILVKSDTKGSFLFKQARIGKANQIFTIYKIRTMTKEASINANNTNLKYVTTSLNDSRITRIGSILRKFHLDELPQLFNVIKCDMSIIGVRPDTPYQENDYSKSVWKKRNLLRPGITGLSQIKSDSTGFNHRKRNKYDLFYVTNKKKFKLDTYIFFKTLLKLFKGNSY